MRLCASSTLDGRENPPPRAGVPPAPDAATGAETALMLGPAAVGSTRHALFAIACGEQALPRTQVVNPYLRARQRFGLKTPAAKKPR